MPPQSKSAKRVESLREFREWIYIALACGGIVWGVAEWKARIENPHKPTTAEEMLNRRDEQIARLYDISQAMVRVNYNNMYEVAQLKQQIALLERKP